MGKNVQHIQVKTTGAKKSQKAIKGVNSGLKDMAKKAGLAAAAYIGANALLGAIKSSIALFGKQEEAEKKLRFAAGEMTEALIAQANALQQNTRFGDEQILAQQAYLASLGLTQQQIEDTISASVDLAAATGMTLESAVLNTSKTLSGMAGELGEKLGPAFRELSIEALKAGDGIKFIAEQFSGTAQADAETFTGQIEQMKNVIGDASEALGGLLAPFLEKVAKTFKSAGQAATKFFRELKESPIESLIRNLREAGVAGESLDGIVLIHLQQNLAKINKQIDEQKFKFNDVGTAHAKIKEISESLLDVTKVTLEKIEERKVTLGRLNGLLKAQRDIESGTAEIVNGKVKVVNKHTGVVKKLNIMELDGIIATTKATLGYSTSVAGLQDELDGVTLRIDGIQERAEKDVANAIKLVEIIRGQILTLTEREEIERKIAELTGTNVDNQNATLTSFDEYVLQQQNLLDEQIKQDEREKERLDNQKKFIKLHYEDAVALGMVSKEQQLLNKYMEEGMSKNEARIAVKVKEEEVKKIKEIEQALIKKHNLSKDFNLKEAHADAYGMAAEAYKAMAGIPIVGPALGVAAAAVAYAAGMSYKAGILKAQYGADFVTDGPQMMMVGEGSGPERVQVTPLSDPNFDGPQGQGITLNISGNVLHESFIEDNVIPQIREGLRLGENMGI